MQSQQRSEETTMYKDDEVSKIFQNKMNRSLIDMQNRSYVVNRNKNNHNDRADKSQILRGNETIGNVADESTFIARLSNKSANAEGTKGCRDVSQIHDVTAGMAGNERSMLLGSNLNDLSDLNEPTLLERLSSS